MRSQRIESIDMLRGIVIILMALDHVRDFWGPTPFIPEDPSQSTLSWFLTRWITHYCAPVFVFLAGTSAFLYRKKINSKADLSRFLISRGFWLILLEILIINPSWSWSFSSPFVQVIWALGWSMIFLAIMVWLPRWLVAIIALLMIFGHNALDTVSADAFGSFHWLWKILHVSAWIPLNLAPDNPLSPFLSGFYVAYPLIPWLGVILAGYLIGPVFQQGESQRKRLLLSAGITFCILFFVLRALAFYGDPNPWKPGGNGIVFEFMAFLNTNKYPPSLLFLSMTIGPALLALVFLEKLRGISAKVFLVFGQAPLFFYLIHIPFIHVTASIYHNMRYGQDFNAFMFNTSHPESYTPQLLLVYFTWLLTVFALYWPTRWYRDLKRNSSNPWLSYL